MATANQRCVALEARLGLLERELVEAEGGEVRIFGCRGLVVVLCAVTAVYYCHGWAKAATRLQGSIHASYAI